jgi:hypothetical protein
MRNIFTRFNFLRESGMFTTFDFSTVNWCLGWIALGSIGLWWNVPEMNWSELSLRFFALNCSTQANYHFIIPGSHQWHFIASNPLQIHFTVDNFLERTIHHEANDCTVIQILVKIHCKIKQKIWYLKFWVNYVHLNFRMFKFWIIRRPPIQVMHFLVEHIWLHFCLVIWCPETK